eukprot:scaffold1377_cov126-Cylindrotheca_fusiformis.AAC.27
MFAFNTTEQDKQATYTPPNQVQELGTTTKPSDNKEEKNRFRWSDRDMSPEARRRRKWCIIASVGVVLIIAISLISVSLKKVDSTEFGIQYNIHKKELDDAAKTGGLFAGPPGYRFIKFPSTFNTVDLDDRTCVSYDGLLWATTVEEAGLSAIHHSCSEFRVTEFQSKRGIIQAKMDENLRLKLSGDPENGLEGVNAVAVALQLRYIGLPTAYNNAVAEKQAAEEDIALAVAQRRQETTRANTELLRAKEEARKILDTAVNEAEVLLTEARLKAEETLFAFEKEAEALVQVKEALGLSTDGVLAYMTNMLISEVSDSPIPSSCFVQIAGLAARVVAMFQYRSDTCRTRLSSETRERNGNQ